MNEFLFLATVPDLPREVARAKENPIRHVEITTETAVCLVSIGSTLKSLATSSRRGGLILTVPTAKIALDVECGEINAHPFSSFLYIDEKLRVCAIINDDSLKTLRLSKQQMCL